MRTAVGRTGLAFIRSLVMKTRDIFRKNDYKRATKNTKKKTRNTFALKLLNSNLFLEKSSWRMAENTRLACFLEINYTINRLG